MISRAVEAEILRLYHVESWPVGTIARQLHIHHGTVRRVLWQSGVPAVRECARTSKLDAYVPFIQETFARYPTLRASRLYQMVRERGYLGNPDHFRHMVARWRPRPAAEAYLRLRTLPAEQAQTDWAHFGKLTIGRAQRPLMAFVMVLSYSRHLFLRFYLNAGTASFLDAHVQAFAYFTAVPRVCLYDNLRSAVLERSGDAIRFNPTLLELAAWYRFQPRPVAVARGNEKGRVERAIRFVRDRFFAARRYTDVTDLNTQALAWCSGEAAARPCPRPHPESARVLRGGAAAAAHVAG
jgi:transposase